MYLGASPLNFGQISHYDAARGECYRDFADPIGVWSRALTEGLFGVRPDLLAKNPVVRLVPGFPAAWDEASVTLPDISYSFRREGRRISYKINNRYARNAAIELTVPVSGVESVKVNGRPAEWTTTENSIGTPRIVIAAGTAPELDIEITEAGKFNPAPTGREHSEGPVKFREMTDGKLKYWNAEVSELAPAVRVPENGFGDIRPELCETADLSGAYNASVTDIFRNEYLSPRPDVTTLQIPKQGVGEWCHPQLTADIDDSGLRARLAAEEGVLKTESGISFALPAEGRNILFTSLWDNYPDSATVGLSGRASHLLPAHGRLNQPHAVGYRKRPHPRPLHRRERGGDAACQPPQLGSDRTRLLPRRPCLRAGSRRTAPLSHPLHYGPHDSHARR